MTHIQENTRKYLQILLYKIIVAIGTAQSDDYLLSKITHYKLKGGVTILAHNPLSRNNSWVGQVYHCLAFFKKNRDRS